MTVAKTITEDTEMMAMVAIVRNYVRDFPELNRLISGEESSDRMIAWAVVDAMEDFNQTPPLIGSFSLSEIPKHILIRMATVSLLESVGILQTRNNLKFSDGGISVGVSDKAPMLMNWIGYMRREFERKKLEWKIAKNIEAAWGRGVHSEYWLINGFYGDW